MYDEVPAVARWHVSREERKGGGVRLSSTVGTAAARSLQLRVISCFDEGRCGHPAPDIALVEEQETAA